MNHNREIQIFEQAPHPIRSGRFYKVEDKWYFMARQYQDQGPFESKEDAIKELEIFLVKMNRDEPEKWEINRNI